MTPEQIEGKWRLLVEDEPTDMGRILTLRQGRVWADGAADPSGTYVAAGGTLTIDFPPGGDNYEERIGIVSKPSLDQLSGTITSTWRADGFCDDQETSQACTLVREPG